MMIIAIVYILVFTNMFLFLSYVAKFNIRRGSFGLGLRLLTLVRDHVWTRYILNNSIFTTKRGRQENLYNNIVPIVNLWEKFITNFTVLLDLDQVFKKIIITKWRA